MKRKWYTACITIAQEKKCQTLGEYNRRKRLASKWHPFVNGGGGDITCMHSAEGPVSCNYQFIDSNNSNIRYDTVKEIT
jgi:hypothetical protein